MLDAPAVTALLQRMMGRAQAGQFAFVVEQVTDTRFVDHAFVRVRPRGPKPWARVSWWARYRSPTRLLPVVGSVAGVGAQVVGREVLAGVEREFGRLLPGGRPDWTAEGASAVCDASDLLLAQGAMLLFVQQCFDLHDLRMQQAARPPERTP